MNVGFGRPGRRERRRGVAAGAATALLATLVTVLNPIVAVAAGSTLFDQPFRNNTANGLGAVALPAVPVGSTSSNFACLSATGNTTAVPLHSCAAASDAPGAGKLRLTDATTNKTGGLFGAVAVPSSMGLDVTFNLYQWGGGGADGMTFALAAVDPASPAAPATLGQSGGALGYSGTKTLAGLANGYMGFGFDVFGNYSTTTYEGTGCPSQPFISSSTRIAGQVVVRGPGRGTVGYCGLNSTASLGTSSPVVPLRAATRAASVVPVEVVINPTTSSFTTASGLVVGAGRYQVRFTPVGQAARTLEGPLPAVAAGLYPSSAWVNSNGVPRQLAFGWVGSTGAVVDYHEVDNAKVVTFTPVPELNVAQTSYNGTAPQPGDPVTYSVVAGVDAGANETAPISVTETLPTGVVPVGAFGSGWICAAPVGQKITCTNSNTPFANGSTLPSITVVGIVTGSSVTPTLIQTTSTATASSIDANPGLSTATTAGTVPAAPSGITVTPASSPIAGGIPVTVGGANLAGATAIEIGTTTEQRAGTPVTLLPCPSGPAAGCFTVNGDGTLAISSMPARGTAATVTVTVVTRGVAGAASYVYTDRPATAVAPTATAGLGSATVSWVAPSSNGSPITSYILTPIRNGVAQTPITYDTSTTTRTLTELTVGASYTFTVAAVNALGTGSPSPASNAVVPFALPGAPTITAASAGDSSATLTWTAPGTGGSPITSYVVTPYIAGVAQTPQTFAGTATTRTVTGLTPGTAYTFTVRATNAGGLGPPSAQSAPVIPNASPTLSNPAPPAGEVGVPYSDQLVVTNGTGPFVWSISAGTLPPGLTLAAGTGLLSGTPGTAGSFAFTVRVTDASGETATQALTVVIAPQPTLTFPTPPQGQVGIGYNIPLSVTGGTGPFIWSITAGSLPAGLTLNTSTGLLSGTPTVAGSYSFSVRVVDAFSQAATRTVAIGVTASPALTFPPPPPGQVGVPYSYQPTVTGGTAPFVWSVSAGSLPPGLTLNATTGLLSGTPTTMGSYPFTVRVVDNAGQQATQAVTLVIAAGPLVVVKTADASTVAAGGTVHYSISVTNTASIPFTAVSVADPLAGVLDDAVYNADATASSGSLSFVSPTLTWNGDLAAGAVVTISYSVTVASPDTGNMVLSNTVTSGTPGTNCASGSADLRCTATVPVSALTIVKTADVTATTPGSPVRYTITATNAGQAAYPGAAFTDALTGVLDDAVYNADATATAGVVSFTSPNLTWTGSLAVGAAVTVSYSVTVRNPDPGDRVMTNTAVSAAVGNNCPSGGVDTRCTAAVTVLVPGLVLTNTASTSAATPGSTVGYTVTMTNSGQTPYGGISVTTSLAGLLDNATYNADATATSGVLGYLSPNLTWTGNLAVGASVTVTFSVTVSTGTTGGRVLTSVLSSAAAGNNCGTGSTDPRCRATVTIVIPGLTIVKTASVPSTTPGSVVAYQIVVTNTGQTPYVGAGFTDSLAGVLDDAAYGVDAVATTGVVSYSAPVLSWTGNLTVGASATITYSVAVADHDSGDRTLTNAVVSTTVGANCVAQNTDPRCAAVVSVLLPGLTLTNTPSVATATPGATVGYTVTIANTGQTPYTATSVTESLTDVLDDAVYNGDVSADSGTVEVSGSVLTWTGSIAVGVTVTVGFTVTVRNPDPGSRVLSATLTSGAVDNNCPVGGSDPSCTATVTVLVPSLTMVMTADTATTTPGGTVTFTVTVTNTGQTPYADATFTNSLANPLNDAVYNNDATASVGSVTYVSPTVSWVGDLAVGASASITYSMTVLDPDPGDKLLVSTVVSTTAGSNCPAGGADPRCTAAVRVLVPALTITTVADAASTTAGSVVGYTVTIANTGQTPYSAVSVTDELAGVLDDAAYNNDASASDGAIVFASPNLTWTGDLALGASVTITFSVTVADPVVGNLILTNRVVSGATGSNCPTGGTDARCVVSVPVARLLIETTTDVSTVMPGGVIRVNATYTNTGQVPYTGISVAFDATDFGDDVAGNGDQTASSGTLTIGASGAVWTGDIAVGATVTLTGSATVLNPDPGDRLIRGTSSSAAPGSNCPEGGTDPRCTVSVSVLVPELSIVKVADTNAVVPGGTVGYTVTVTNSGTAPYSDITVTDSLTGVLDDATYSGDVVASAGLVSFADSTLTWTGDVPVGAVVTISYTVTVRAPDPGDKTMVNTVGSTAVGSSCSAMGQAPSCTSTVVVLTPGLTIAKSADAVTGNPGSTVTYTLTITNSGQVDYSAISVVDDLTGVVDDAVYNADADPTAGTVLYTAPVLTWTGDLAVGVTVTVTYTVTIDNPDLGDLSLVNSVTSAAAGANCPTGGTDPRCGSTVAVVEATTLTFTKTASVTSAVAGSVVEYTIVVANSGGTPYLGATFDDSLTDVLGHAEYNDDASATGGGTIGYTEPVLSWSGDVPATSSVVVTYSVTVVAHVGGDDVIFDTVVSDSPNNNCGSGSGDPRCTTSVSISELAILNTANVASATPGSLVRLTTTMRNTGGTAYYGVVVNFGGADLLDDADPTGDQTVSSGTTVVGPDGLQWIGDIPIDGVVTVSADFRVKHPDPGNRVMSSTVSSAIPGNNCPTGGTDPACTVSVDILIPALSIDKTADTPVTAPGGTVGYTITITNTGTAPYLGAVVTDTMTGALDDASYGADATATAGALSYAAPTLTWTGDLPVGGSAIVTYTMTVFSPDEGDKTMVNVVSSAEIGSDCPPASSNPDCSALVVVLTPGLSMAITAGAASTTPGARVAYTVTVANTGQTAQSAVTVSNALAGVLDDATYNDDAVASVGAVTFTSPNLTWTGSLAPGGTATITYSVTVANPDPGNRRLTSTVSSSAGGSTCPAGNTTPACAATVTVSVLSILNTAAAPTTVPGAVVRFTTTVANTGQTPYTGISIDADFFGSVDDGIYNGDAAASTGTLVLLPGTASIRWTGDLPVGAVLTVTGTFTVRDPDPGDETMTSVISTAVPGSNCPAGGTDPACTATVTVLIPGLTVVKTSNATTIIPGEVVGYTITVTNTGETPYSAATIADSLAGLLDDAAYNEDATATAGTVSYVAPEITWTGALAIGAAVTITYTITADDPQSGERVLTNVVSSTTQGSNCPSGSGDPACTATVNVLVPALNISKNAAAGTVTPGSTLGYTITVTNTGQTAYPAATVTDTLTGVLDDAVYNDDAVATGGEVSYAAPVLTWTGDLAVGASAVISYSVVVRSPVAGDQSLTNAVASTAPGNNCPPGSTDPACAVTVAVLIPALTISSYADVAAATPGDVVRLTATFTNTGSTAYTGISVVTDAADLFDDARPNGDQVASSGTFTVIDNAVTWTGDIPIGGVVTITGTITVNNPDTGNRILSSTLTTNAPGSNCPVAAPQSGCTITVPVLIPGLVVEKAANSPTTTPGGTVTYTITATNTGQTPYDDIEIVDSLSGLLGNATYNGDASALVGTLSYTAPTLTWTGDLAVGGAVTISYTVTASSSQTGGRSLANAVTSTAPGNNCPVGSMDPRCTADVAILIPGLTITKTADSATITGGDVVTYTVTVSNTGQAPYTGATFADPLTGVLDDAAYNNDATTTAGAVSYAAPVVSWTGDLVVGATAVITYSVTVSPSGAGDDSLVNTVTSDTVGGNCPAGPADPACTAEVTVLIPALTIAKTADTSTVVAGGTVRYSILVTNSGQSPYSGATITDSLAGLLDEADYADDATATVGVLAYDAPNLTWTGDLPIGAMAAITYTVTVHQPPTGDGHLVNTVTSGTIGSNCPAGGGDTRCTTETLVAEQEITLTSLTPRFTIGVQPDSVFVADDAVTMTVITNSPTGYAVLVQATAPEFTAADPVNPYTIPVENLRVRENGTQSFHPLSDVTPVVVHRQPTPSAPGGDAIGNDYEFVIPMSVVADSYSITLEYIAITQ